MNIAVNTRSFSKKNNSGNDIEQILIALAKANPQHQFVFFINKELEITKNITLISTKASVNVISEKLWHSIQLPALLKKHKADMVIHINTINTTSTSIPQLHFINMQPKGTKRNISETLHQSKKIITSSQSFKTLLTTQYKIADEKVALVYASADSRFSPVDWKEKQSILKKYSAEKEYFLFIEEDQTEEELVQLLKAFSIFKKWQKSNLQMIIAYQKAHLPEPFLKSLKNYKYKDEVLLINFDEAMLPEITKAAYCCIHFNDNSSYLSLLQNLRSGVPVITTENDLTKEICGKAALYSPVGNLNDIAKNMILIYKDETLRNELIENGTAQLQLLNTNKPLTTLMLQLEATLQA
ncbi:glycosyltransferase [Ferruginibacter sp. SUN002]|uniref:glycosyltransferase n=1 Tax=Ferruginibacter sp. SUN002 TaxID=2937789 RepID=UPI003D35F621